MSEKNFWSFVRKNLDLKMYRVENRASAGMPDIHYVSKESSGWIELKYIKELPKKRNVRSGLKRVQSLWHEAYQRHGGTSWILLRVGRTSIILIDGCHAVAISNGVTASDLIKRSSWSYKGNLNEEIWENLKGAINGQNKENNRNIGESQ